MFLAIQNSLVLGSFENLEAAELRCKEEIKKDSLELLLKKKVIKKILKGQIPVNGNVYLVVNVVKEVRAE